MKTILCDVCGKIIEDECVKRGKGAFVISRMFPRGHNREKTNDEMDICQECFEYLRMQRKAARFNGGENES